MAAIFKIYINIKTTVEHTQAIVDVMTRILHSDLVNYCPFASNLPLSRQKKI